MLTRGSMDCVNLHGGRMLTRGSMDCVNLHGGRMLTRGSVDCVNLHGGRMLTCGSMDCVNLYGDCGSDYLADVWMMTIVSFTANLLLACIIPREIPFFVHS